MEQFKDLLYVLAFIISLISLIIVIIKFFKDGNQGAKTEAKELGKMNESLLKANLKLDQVCTTTSETRTDIKALNKNIGELDKRLTIVERDNISLSTRLDELAQQIDQLKK